MIHSILESKMREAIDLDENKNKDGSINWNFVDADAYANCKNLFRSDADFYQAFDSVANGIQTEDNTASNEYQLEMEV
ncbi:hypothetical protein OAP94_01865 [bacterium]|nr:hypothetical protein [bacterium]MDC1007409.1 hypothetical protein [bacterium]